MEESFHADDDLTDLPLDEVASKIRSETAQPRGFTVVKQPEFLLLLYIMVTDILMPVTTAAITLKNDFTFAISIEGKSLPATTFSDVVKGPITRMSQIVNLMAIE